MNDRSSSAGIARSVTPDKDRIESAGPNKRKTKRQSERKRKRSCTDFVRICRDVTTSIVVFVVATTPLHRLWKLLDDDAVINVKITWGLRI